MHVATGALNNISKTQCFFLSLLFVLPAVLLANPGKGQLFGTSGNGGELLAINTDNGSAFSVGSIGGGVPALAMDTNSGIMYAGTGGGDANILIVNSNTGESSLLGDTQLGFAAVGSLDFDNNGTLYASVNMAGNGGTGSDHLATIDLDTGVASIIGAYDDCTGVEIPTDGGGQCALDGLEAIAFDASGQLWGAVRGRADNPGLYTIDTGTGNATFVSEILDPSGAPDSGGIVSLQFGCDGTLYGGTARSQEGTDEGSGQASDGGALVTIDPADGSMEYLSDSLTGGSSLGGLAFGSPCDPKVVPTLSVYGAALMILLLMVLGYIGIQGTRVRA